MNRRLISLMLLGSVFLPACSTVQPWQRGELAQASMAWDPDPMKAALNSHVYDSKEASSGRIGLAGGGCGCN